MKFSLKINLLKTCFPIARGFPGACCPPGKPFWGKKILLLLLFGLSDAYIFFSMIGKQLLGKKINKQTSDCKQNKNSWTKTFCLMILRSISFRTRSSSLSFKLEESILKRLLQRNQQQHKDDNNNNKNRLTLFHLVSWNFRLLVAPHYFPVLGISFRSLSLWNLLSSSAPMWQIRTRLNLSHEIKIWHAKLNTKDPCIREHAATAQTAGAQSEYRDEERSQRLAWRQRGERS